MLTQEARQVSTTLGLQCVLGVNIRATKLIQDMEAAEFQFANGGQVKTVSLISWQTWGRARAIKQLIGFRIQMETTSLGTAAGPLDLSKQGIIAARREYVDGSHGSDGNSIVENGLQRE
jgi:hypothetical protein